MTTFKVLYRDRLKIRRVARGFSMVEVLMVLAITGILAALAGPSFTGTIERYRVSTVVDELAGSVAVTRNEAVKRGGNVRLERLSGSAWECPTLSSVQQWSCGWRVYVDSNGNAAWNSGEEVIREFRITNGLTVNFSSNAAGVTANRWGQLGGLGAIGFNVVPPSGVSSVATTSLCLSSAGRIRKVQGVVCP